MAEPHEFSQEFVGTSYTDPRLNRPPSVVPHAPYGKPPAIPNQPPAVLSMQNSAHGVGNPPPGYISQHYEEQIRHVHHYEGQRQHVQGSGGFPSGAIASAFHSPAPLSHYGHTDLPIAPAPTHSVPSTAFLSSSPVPLSHYGPTHLPIAPAPTPSVPSTAFLTPATNRPDAGLDNASTSTPGLIADSRKSSNSRSTERRGRSGNPSATMSEQAREAAQVAKKPPKRKYTGTDNGDETEEVLRSLCHVDLSDIVKKFGPAPLWSTIKIAFPMVPPPISIPHPIPSSSSEIREDIYSPDFRNYLCPRKVLKEALAALDDLADLSGKDRMGRPYTEATCFSCVSPIFTLPLLCFKGVLRQEEQYYFRKSRHFALSTGGRADNVIFGRISVRNAILGVDECKPVISPTIDQGAVFYKDVLAQTVAGTEAGWVENLTNMADIPDLDITDTRVPANRYHIHEYNPKHPDVPDVWGMIIDGNSTFHIVRWSHPTQLNRYQYYATQGTNAFEEQCRRSSKKNNIKAQVKALRNIIGCVFFVFLEMAYNLACVELRMLERTSQAGETDHRFASNLALTRKMHACFEKARRTLRDAAEAYGQGNKEQGDQLTEEAWKQAGRCTKIARDSEREDVEFSSYTEVYKMMEGEAGDASSDSELSEQLGRISISSDRAPPNAVPNNESHGDANMESHSIGV